MLHPAEEESAHTPVRRFNTDLMRWEAWLWAYEAWSDAERERWSAISNASAYEPVVSYEDTWAEPTVDRASPTVDRE